MCSGYTPSSISISPSAPTLTQHLLSIADGEKWCFAHMDITDEGRVIANTIIHGEAIAISDGSFKDLYGTAAWVFEGENETGCISGAV